MAYKEDRSEYIPIAYIVWCYKTLDQAKPIV